MKYDYVVIGAGVSGMTSAIILAKNGYHVALVEKSGKTAPVLRGFTRNGVFFDTGFHYTGSFGKGEILDVAFSYLGLIDKLEKVAYDSDCFDMIRCLEPEFDFCFPYGYNRIREKFYKEFPRDKEAVNIYFQTVENIYSSLPYINPYFDMPSAKKIKNMQGFSLKQFLDRITENRKLKYLLSAHCFLHGVSPEEIPLANHISVVGSFYESVHGIRGGGKALARAFDLHLEKSGVDLYCGKGVREILFAPDRTFSGVRLEDDTVLKSLGGISTIHPLSLLNIVPNSPFRPVYEKRLKHLEETFCANMLYAICNSPLKHLAKSNMFICPDIRGTDFLMKESFEKKPLYIASTRHDLSNAANHGFIAISPVSNSCTERWSDSFTGRRPDDYNIYKKEIAEKMQRHIENVCPEISGEITYTECATPLTFRDFANSPFGSLYGVKHKLGQENPVPRTRAKGLFLAGQAVTVPGILGAVISGFEACGHIVGHNHLQKELNEFRT